MNSITIELETTHPGSEWLGAINPDHRQLVSHLTNGASATVHRDEFRRIKYMAESHGWSLKIVKGESK